VQRTCRRPSTPPKEIFRPELDRRRREKVLRLELGGIFVNRSFANIIIIIIIIIIIAIIRWFRAVTACGYSNSIFVCSDRV